MSNTLAIAAVTAMLKDILENELVNHPVAISIGDLLVTALPPDRISVSSDERPQLNIFLYQVSQNRNADWIRCDSKEKWRLHPINHQSNHQSDRKCKYGNEYLDESANGETPLALDLHYLITAYGAKDFQAELLLGYAMQVLHDMPLITRERICTALKHAAVMTSFGALSQVLATMPIEDLADLIGPIKLSPEFFSMEETSKLWSSLQTHYRPSAAYQASMVLLGDRCVPTDSEAAAIVLPQPMIEQVALERGRSVTSDRLVIEGQRLQGTLTYVRMAGRSALLHPQVVQDRLIYLGLPPDLPAGVQGVQVVHLEANQDRTVAEEVQSNMAAFVLPPVIQAQVTAVKPSDSNLCNATLTLAVKPLIHGNQQVMLLLHAVAGDRSSYRFAVPPREAPLETLVVPVQVQAGRYWVQIQVDGAQSPSPTASDLALQVTIS